MAVSDVAVARWQREGERGGPLDLKMPLENGRTDERVSRGQASERAVCVCEAVSVEKGERRPLERERERERERELRKQ